MPFTPRPSPFTAATRCCLSNRDQRDHHARSLRGRTAGDRSGNAELVRAKMQPDAGGIRLAAGDVRDAGANRQHAEPTILGPDSNARLWSELNRVVVGELLMHVGGDGDVAPPLTADAKVDRRFELVVLDGLLE